MEAILNIHGFLGILNLLANILAWNVGRKYTTINAERELMKAAIVYNDNNNNNTRLLFVD